MENFLDHSWMSQMRHFMAFTIMGYLQNLPESSRLVFDEFFFFPICYWLQRLPWVHVGKRWVDGWVGVWFLWEKQRCATDW
jgi:hypothetical protein